MESQLELLNTFSPQALNKVPFRAWPKVIAINFQWLRKCVELSSGAPIYWQALKAIGHEFKLPPTANMMPVAKAARLTPKGVPFNARLNYAAVYKVLERLRETIDGLVGRCQLHELSASSQLSRDLCARDLKVMIKCLSQLGYLKGPDEGAREPVGGHEAYYLLQLNLVLCFLVVTLVPDLDIYTAAIDEIPDSLKLASLPFGVPTQVDVFGTRVWREINYLELIQVMLLVHDAGCHNRLLAKLVDSQLLPLGLDEPKKQKLLEKFDFIEHAAQVFEPLEETANDYNIRARGPLARVSE